MKVYRGWLWVPEDETGAAIMIEADIWTYNYSSPNRVPFIEFEVEVTSEGLKRLELYWGVALWGLTLVEDYD